MPPRRWIFSRWRWNRWCVRFLEAVPWTEEEENRVVSLIPFLSEEESKELVARVSPVGEDACEAMLQGLLSFHIHGTPPLSTADLGTARTQSAGEAPKTHHHLLNLLSLTFPSLPKTKPISHPPL